MNARSPMAGLSESKRALQDAVRAFRIGEAEDIYRDLVEVHGVDPDSDEMLPPRVTLGILRGHVRDMLCMLNNLGEDRAPGLKVVCLQMMGDPLWERLAEAVESTSPDPEVRRSMRAMLDAAREA